MPEEKNKSKLYESIRKTKIRFSYTLILNLFLNILFIKLMQK